MWRPSSRTLSLSHVTIVQSSIPVIARASRQAFAVRAVELACDVEFLAGGIDSTGDGGRPVASDGARDDARA